MKVPVLKKDNKFYVELPSELGENELELFKLKEGYYLLSTQLSKKEEPVKKSNQISLSESELNLLSKLLSIKFETRNPAHIMRTFTKEEKEILKGLLRKKHVHVFYGKKYKNTGVYSIDERIFSLWKKLTSEKPSIEPKKPIIKEDFFSAIFRNGYMVIDNEIEARKISEELKTRPERNSIMGSRSFDGKFYLVTKNYYIKLSNSIQEKVKESTSISEVSELCNAPSDACRAVLLLMAEKGDMLENKKGVYSVV